MEDLQPVVLDTGKTRNGVRQSENLLFRLFVNWTTHKLQRDERNERTIVYEFLLLVIVLHPISKTLSFQK